MQCSPHIDMDSTNKNPHLCEKDVTYAYYTVYPFPLEGRGCGGLESLDSISIHSLSKRFLECPPPR